MRSLRPLRAFAEVALGRQRSPQYEDGPFMVPYLRAANVKDGELDLSDVKSMSFSPNEQRIYALRPGDVLVSEGSGSLGTVGASAVWSGEINDVVCFQNTLLRLRPRSQSTDPKFLAWWARHAFGSGLFAGIAAGANIYHISAERVRALQVSFPDVLEQRRIADFLESEATRIDQMIEKKSRLVALLEERVETLMLQRIADSNLVAAEPRISSLPIKRLLQKLNRPAMPGGTMITAFRDGQVTARALRRADGYTESWSEDSRLQGVCKGDVVIHGLDGFAGAIGVSEVDGVCSPIYHVCRPIGNADATYLGRMMRVLAISGYLGLFASSTRERAVDLRNWDLLGRIPTPDVSTQEQREIAGLIKRIHPLDIAVKQSAELAREYRQALISLAVTGQLHTRGVPE
jgi:type I restriction enzyme S subunit